MAEGNLEIRYKEHPHMVSFFFTQVQFMNAVQFEAYFIQTQGINLYCVQVIHSKSDLTTIS